MNFRITGPGFYKTRDGRMAEVVAAKSTFGGFRYWTGQVEGWGLVEWWPDGVQETGEENPNDLMAPWGEPVAAAETTSTVPANTPYHRTQQFRAETARMLILEMARLPETLWSTLAERAVYRADAMPLETLAGWAVQSADALIAALDKPAQLHRTHNQTGGEK